MKKFLLTAALLAFALAARAQDIAFIAHPETRETTILTNDAQSMLLGNLSKWRSGPVIKLVVLTEGPVHESAIKTYAQRTPDQFEKHWKKLVFTGAGSMPVQAKTEAEVVAYVAANPGAFGYVARASAGATVKIITVQ